MSCPTVCIQHLILTLPFQALSTGHACTILEMCALKLFCVSLFRRRNGGTERLQDLPKVIQLVFYKGPLHFSLPIVSLQFSDSCYIGWLQGRRREKMCLLGWLLLTSLFSLVMVMLWDPPTSSGGKGPCDAGEQYLGPSQARS